MLVEDAFAQIVIEPNTDSAILLFNCKAFVTFVDKLIT